VKLTVKKDNAGSLTFSDLLAKSGDQLSGEAKWTCSE
jgi:hypothetical protein